MEEEKRMSAEARELGLEGGTLIRNTHPYIITVCPYCRVLREGCFL
jgi:hypothetical protein